jgi:hypothetical protein
MPSRKCMTVYIQSYGFRTETNRPPAILSSGAYEFWAVENWKRFTSAGKCNRWS